MPPPKKQPQGKSFQLALRSFSVKIKIRSKKRLKSEDFRCFLELLGGFKPPISSLPNSSDCDFGRFPNLSRPFLSAGPCSPALLFPLLPSAHFPVWVTVWVKKLPQEYDASTEDLMRGLATSPLHASVICMTFAAESCEHTTVLST